MKWIKNLALVLAVLVALFLFVANFSEVETRYRCEGKFTRDGRTEMMTAYLKLHDYRWWVRLWSSSKGAAWIEIPNLWIEYFSNLKGVGDQVQIGDGQKVLGSFSTLSNSLAVNIFRGEFIGECMLIK